MDHPKCLLEKKKKSCSRDPGSPGWQWCKCWGFLQMRRALPRDDWEGMFKAAWRLGQARLSICISGVSTECHCRNQRSLCLGSIIQHSLQAPPSSVDTTAYARRRVGRKLTSGNQARLSGPVTVGDWFLTLEKNASDVKSSIISISQMRKPKLSWSSAIQWASDRFGIGSHPFSVWARVPSISSLGPKSMWRCISQMEQTWVAGWVEFFGKGRQWELCCRDFMMEGLRGQALESRLDVVGKGLGT